MADPLGLYDGESGEILRQQERRKEKAVAYAEILVHIGHLQGSLEAMQRECLRMIQASNAMKARLAELENANDAR